MKWASLLFGDFHKIPIQWQSGFRAEWIETCYVRMQILAGCTLVYPLMVAPALFIFLYTTEPLYLAFVVITIISLFVVSAFTLIKIRSYQNLDLSDRAYQTKYKLILLYSIMVLIFIDASFLTIWYRTGINAPYVIGVFLYALIFYQPNKFGLIAYVSNFIFYLIFISIFRFSFHYQSIAYFSGIVSTFGGWLVASMMYNSRIEAFINNHTIQLQSLELQKVNEELHKLVNTDGLTQVANRRKFDRHLDLKYRELSDKSTLGILLCDVDYFKLFNDHYGHQAGDECLQKVAATIQAEIRQEEDLVARYGGEEFVIILCNTSETEAMQVAQRICYQVQNLHIPHDRSPLHEVTISIGISCQIPSLFCSSEQLISQADRALYAAKSKGRNQAIICTSVANL